MDLLTLVPGWLSAIATAIAAGFACMAASAAKKSADKQAELLAVDLRPVLGLSNVSPGLTERFPLHLYFTNYGKGAAWVKKVIVKEGEMPIETHIGTPVCVGTGDSSEIKVILTESNRKYLLCISIFYWDANDNAHCTAVRGYFGWMQNVNPFPLWEIENEETNHNVPGLIKPPHVINQPGKI